MPTLDIGGTKVQVDDRFLSLSPEQQNQTVEEIAQQAGISGDHRTDLARIKSNVRKMMDQNAPETDIDAYIAGEGVTVEQVRNSNESALSLEQQRALAMAAARKRQAEANPATGAVERWQDAPLVTGNPRSGHEQHRITATLEEIEAALRKADAAGNTEDAKRLADAYRRVQAQQSGWQGDPIVGGAQQSGGGRWQDAPLLGNGQPNALQRYNQSLESVRQQQFADMPLDKFSKFADDSLAPYGANELLNHSLSLGLLDEINAGGSAAVSGVQKLFTGKGPGFGETYSTNKALEEARRDLGREQAGGLGLAAEIGGGLATAAPGKALQVGNAAIQQGGKFLPQLAKNFKAALPGAGVAGAYGAGATDGGIQDRAQGAGIGAGTGAALGTAAPYAMAGLQKVANATMRTLQRAPIVGKAAELVNAEARYQGSLNRAIKQAPAAQAIKRQASALFDEIAASDTVLTPTAMRGLTVKVGKSMQVGRMKPRFDKGAQSILDELTELSQGPVHISELHTVRQQAQALMSNGEAVGRDDFFLQTVVRQIDDFLGKIKPVDLAGKSGSDKGNELLRGIGLWSRYKSAQSIERAIEKAGRAKGGFASGLRSQFVSILNSQAKSRNFTKTDLSAMQKFVDGGALNVALEKLGSARGIMGAAAGGVTSGPVGMVGVPLAGALAKGSLNRSARSTATKLLGQVASGGVSPAPIAQSRLPALAGQAGTRGGFPLIEKQQRLLSQAAN